MTNVIDTLQKRGFIDRKTDENLAKILNESVTCYVGFDPTSDSLHLGNLVGIIALYWLKKFNHKAIALVGGATARIGDPSGKSLERPFLDDSIILHNAAKIEKFLKKVLGNDVEFVNNNDWFSKILFTDFLRDVGKQFRIGPMLSKESVKLRMQSEEGMSFTEFSYQILQGYDYYYLNEHKNVTLQMGGSDQWGNITAGIELVRKMSKKPVYGFTFPLLTRSDGKKFGKTEDGAIWLDEDKLSSYQFYQYLIRVPDQDVIKLLKMLTFLDLEKILEIENDMAKSTYIPNTAQKILAEEVTKFVHEKEGLEKALKVTDGLKPGSDAVLDVDILKEISNDMPKFDLTINEILGNKFSEISFKINLTTSKSEAVKLIKNGGAYLNNKKVTDPNYLINESDIIGKKFLLFSSGKKKKILIEIFSK
ncbi:MAG: tyrosine--tRNA ligase [Chlamydiae bacterium RIFCSPHIGHO2_12_FULL_27_8]|nr:MAG: tyrosine--tRNA ligase [Chlamydiae bacterium RIFCSPHIGHO2_12_FULL_27_8]